MLVDYIIYLISSNAKDFQVINSEYTQSSNHDIHMT
jgi:hypothetical protein